MKTLLLTGLLFVSAFLRAEERTLTLLEIDWREQRLPGEPSQATPVMVDNRSVLLIHHTNATPLTMRLLDLPNPKISSAVYAMVGEIRYENVKGEGFLEMWSSFPPAQPGQPEARFFSRTLEVSGEMGRISGTANWRAFLVPFNRTGTTNPPAKLEFNLVLPGSGTVYLGPLKLVEYPVGGSTPAGRPGGAWWSDQTAGWLGGIMGAGLGCLAGLLGWLAGQGKARGFVLVTLAVLILLGGLSGVAGLVALLMRQPFMVWFVLVLPAILVLTILPARLGQYRRHYESLELRRMASMDAP